jgi:hypothetical protein
VVIHEFSIPFAVDLTKETKWNRAKDHPYGYWIIRCHFLIRQRQTNAAVVYGRKLAIIETADGVQPETVDSIKTKFSTMQVRETVFESIKQAECMRTFTDLLAVSIGSDPIGKISAHTKDESVYKLVETFKQSFKIQETVTKEEEREYKLTYKVDPSVITRLVAVAAYQCYAYDVYLTYADYLSVRYTKGPLAVRKKRTKRPLVDGHNHKNWIKINVPLVSISLWHPLLHSAILIPENEYVNQMENEEEIKIDAPQTTHRYFVGKPACSTLYQISNVAFPLKWIKRKTVWTEDELKKIEEGETDAVCWFWQSKE